MATESSRGRKVFLEKLILEMMKCQIANLSSFCLGLLQSLSWRLSRLGTLESIVLQQFYFASLGNISNLRTRRSQLGI